MKRGTPEHPKMKDLADRLGIPLAHAVGIMEMLWHFTAKFAPQGDIGKFPDKAIAKAVGWEKHSGSAGVTSEFMLSSALVRAGFLDPVPEQPHIRFLVHDWKDHADQSVRRYLARQKLDFASKSLAITSLPLPLPTAIASATAASKPPQVALRPISVEFPKASEFIKAKFPSTDDAFIRTIVDRAVQEVIGAGEDPGLVTDEVLLQALFECTTKKQHSAALYLSTVVTWMRNKASA
jgi:hypothetical protein